LRAHSSLGVAARWSIFVLSFFGFSVKTGLIPFNRWLPEAHPIAPANISALLSGALLNLGVYGIVRVNLDLMPVTSVGPGLVVLVIGAFSALTGILYANRGNDLKEVLANSSIENLGIVCAGLGAAMVLGASGYPVIAGIALIAALYHMTNHSAYKALLFSELERSMVRPVPAKLTNWGTHSEDALGGVFLSYRHLVNIGLAPLNGFVSEWLTLQALLQSAVLSSARVKIILPSLVPAWPLPPALPSPAS